MAQALPSAQKQLGAFYTPPELASFMVDWAVDAQNNHVLDPSCGDAVFLQAAERRLKEVGMGGSARIVGVEIDEYAAKGAQARVPDAELHNQDFFDIPAGTWEFDAIVGNPPYIRYHFFRGEDRRKALARSMEQGVRLSELSSSWAPFLVHAASFLKMSGKLALVLPSELLVTDYAEPIREYLLRRFAQVHILSFDYRVFSDALVDAVVILAEGEGPGIASMHRVTDPSFLRKLNLKEATAIGHSRWSNGWSSSASASALESVQGLFQRLGDVASVDIGVVTGANKFFLLNNATAVERKIREADLTPAVSKMAQLKGHQFSVEDWRECKEGLGDCWLFTPEHLDSNSRAYVHHGESSGYNGSFKCRIRSPWWKLKVPNPPRLLLSYMSNDLPRLVENSAGAVTTNLIHNVRPLDETCQPQWLALAWNNSATMLSCELSGRAYGGGVLKLETREAESVLVPIFSEDKFARLTSVAAEIDRLLRVKAHNDLFDLVDGIVLKDTPADTRLELRKGWADLQHRRKSRTKTTVTRSQADVPLRALDDNG